MTMQIRVLIVCAAVLGMAACWAWAIWRLTIIEKRLRGLSGEVLQKEQDDDTED